MRGACAAKAHCAARRRAGHLDRSPWGVYDDPGVPSMRSLGFLAGSGIALALTLGLPCATATDRFVDPLLGLDNNPFDCTPASSPCRTITRAMDAAVSGDRILAAPGVYGQGEVLPIRIQ